jgi:uncharacterized protein (TIGR02679 family)
MSDAARRYLTRPAFTRLWAATRDRYERNGRAAGRVTLDALTAAEAHEIAGLLGPRLRRPLHEDRRLSVTLEVIEQELLASRFELELDTALEIVGGPLQCLPQQRAAAAAAADEFWSRWLEHPACQDPTVAAWVLALRSSGQARLARPDDGRALDRALSAALLLDEEGPTELATLAAGAGADPHCLDHDQPAGKLLLGLLAHHQGVRLPRSAGERRALLARGGLHHDALSSDALCLGLTTLGDGSIAGMLQAMSGRHVRLTYAHLRGETLRFRVGLIIHTCENPTIVARAEQLTCPPPLVCTDGQPSTAVALLLDMLVGAGAEIRHHSDFDVGGLNIATLMQRQHGAQPWRYDTSSYEQAVARIGGRAPTLAPSRLAAFAGGPLNGLAAAMRTRRVAVYEEDVLDLLTEDLSAIAARAAAGRQ